MTSEEQFAEFHKAQRALQQSQAKTEIILADILDSIKRLERIALSPEVRLQDVEGTLAQLEGRQKKLQ
jgi:DNA-binding TFAR19-related protein (PDSD5 family)